MIEAPRSVGKKGITPTSHRRHCQGYSSKSPLLSIVSCQLPWIRVSELDQGTVGTFDNPQWTANVSCFSICECLTAEAKQWLDSESRGHLKCHHLHQYPCGPMLLAFSVFRPGWTCGLGDLVASLLVVGCG